MNKLPIFAAQLLIVENMANDKDRLFEKIYFLFSPSPFHGDRKIKSLQTDGYNVYTYLDKEQGLVNIEHICCWAHARQKFKLAYEQGSDNRTRIFLELIGSMVPLPYTVLD